MNPSRRQFLKTLGTGAAIASVSAVIGVPRGHGAQPPDVTRPGSFGRMFRLPPFAPPTAAVQDALLEIGKVDGIMDAQDDLTAGPMELILNPNLSMVNRDNPTHTAGVTFFGQFLDHDMTFDPLFGSAFRVSRSIHRMRARRSSISIPFTPEVPAALRSCTILPMQLSFALKAAVS